MLRCPTKLFQSIKEANQTFIIRTIKQHFFFNMENSFIIFVLGSLSLKKIIVAGFQGVKSILYQNRKGKNDQSRTVEGETGLR
jgi:hypothetical protein